MSNDELLTKANSNLALCCCYCEKCKMPLTGQDLIESDTAWCPACSVVVTTSSFGVPVWTVGSTIWLVSNWLLIA
jgi:hypothetical protein